jgi:hypothetical protein
VSNLILSSNYIGNKLEGVGEATLENNCIYITAEPNTVVTLLRSINKVVLLQPKNVTQIVNGVVNLGDVYILDNFDKKISIKVENDNVKHETNIYIDNEKIIDATSSKRKTTLTAGVLILILLVVSVVFGVQQKNKNDFNAVSEIKLNEALESYNLKTRESFVTANEIATKLKNDGYKSDKLNELLKNISDSESEILGEVKSETKDLLDLTLQINGFNGTKIASTNDTIFVLDENEKNIIQLDINGKNAKIVAKKDILEGLINIASYQDRLFTLNKDGIYEINNTRTKVKDLDWGDSLFYLYSANIYMVDKGNNKIYRFSGNNKTFADKTDWLAPGIEADFSKAVDMTIDGSIWVLSSSGRITRFTNGNPTNISVDGIAMPLENPTAIYTNETLKNVYVLDKQNGRVVVIDKNGKFKMQYVSDNIKNTNDLVVSEEKGKIILLSGSKIIYVSI